MKRGMYMKVEQFVMAYGVEQDRLRAILPEGFVSLRPVLRINAEVRDDRTGYVEFHTAVERDGKKGWLNIGYWEAVSFKKERQRPFPMTFWKFLLQEWESKVPVRRRRIMRAAILWGSP